METRRLFYEDSHLYQFTANITSCEPFKSGFLVTLDETAFYPEGGGQACDLGTLGGAKVLDVQEKEGKILHLCSAALEVGSRVEGKVDAARRLDLMQQHSGEHIVSGIICSKFGYHNVGFHVGSDMMEIDFDGPVPPEALPEIERLANEAVWANIPIRCWYPSQEELPHVPYRSKKALPWPVRVVQIAETDSCACCGVHVKNTGEIGLIKIVSCVKFHGGVRIELCCGSRALKLTQAVFAQNKLVSQAFSAKMLETGAAAAKMNEMLAAEKLRANTLQSEIFDKTAWEFANKGNVWLFSESLSPAQCRELADKIAKKCGGWCAVLGGREGSYSLCIVSLQGDVKEIGARLGAKGGGKPGYFQGAVSASRAQIEEILKQC